MKSFHLFETRNIVWIDRSWNESIEEYLLNILDAFDLNNVDRFHFVQSRKTIHFYSSKIAYKITRSEHKEQAMNRST